MRPARWLKICKLGGVLALLGTLTSPTRAQEPAFVRGLALPVVNDTIGYPRGVTADQHTEEVFVCDTRKNRILIFDLDGLFHYAITGGDVFTAPRDVAIDPDGFLILVANRGRRSALIELDFDGLFLREIPLTEMPDGSVETKITSVALSPSGDQMYVVDIGNHQLWIADRSGAIVTSVDLAPGASEKDKRDLIVGHVDVYGETVLVSVASAGEIRMFDLDGNFQGRAGVKGTGPCSLGLPVAAALDENDELVIVDQQRMLVLRWNHKTNRCLGEYIGLGDLAGYLYYPMDLSLDRSGRIFVSQGFRGRVQMYEGMTPAAPPPRSP